MNKYIKILLFTALGALLGFGYYYFFGCETNCTIKSDWKMTTMYGMLIGIIAGFPTKKTQKSDK